MTEGSNRLFRRLRERGFDLDFRSHAEAILATDFFQQAETLESVLVEFSIPVSELVAGGGGEAPGTQRLRNALNNRGWVKHRFEIEKRIDGEPSQSRSHEVDHFCFVPEKGRLALEIEWNNKDPFFDRDLEHFQRLHSDGAISVGLILTRGRSLQETLQESIAAFLRQQRADSFASIRTLGYRPTERQKNAISRAVERGSAFIDAVASVLVADKFG